MNRIAALIFVLIFSLNSLTAGEGERFFSLYRHYLAHQEKNSGITLENFLYHHYITDDGDPMDDSEEKDLPFKSELTSCKEVINQASRSTINSGSDFKIIPLHKAANNNYSQSFEAGVWQPPKGKF